MDYRIIPIAIGILFLLIVGAVLTSNLDRAGKLGILIALVLFTVFGIPFLILYIHSALN
ncbi:hypothetical protein [Bacillus toyonensis]|uniref:hypothetical protein n=1 Tax=Bacillus toyonensis TaxID=155322 RepID=UPI00159BB881|nr:hypothetical protein [Bacillus toyonensis]